MAVQISENGFTRTQKAMLAVLRDGKDHPVEELHACLADDLGPLTNVRAHLSTMRKHLKKQGLWVLCANRQYRLMRLANL